jgi:hypothetical protein
MSEPGLVVLLALGSDLPIKVLALVGGTFLGALLIGLLVQLVAKSAFKQTVPPWPLRIVRIFGGVLCGWLVYLWLFGGGGGGLGGPGGGWGGGGGADSKNKKDADSKNKAKEKDKEKEKDKDIGKTPPPTRRTPTARTRPRRKEKDKDIGKTPPPEETLRIEVLGDEPLKKIAKSETPDSRKRYRIQGESKLYTFEEVRKRIKERRSGTPPLRRLVVVVYLDSPARDRPQVRDLEDWARDLEPDPQRGKLKVDFSAPDENAPID